MWGSQGTDGNRAESIPCARAADALRGQVCNNRQDNMLQAAFGIDFEMPLNTNDVVNATLHFTVNA